MPRLKFALLALAACGAWGTASSAPADVANTPLASSSSTIVKPNVMFVLDDSGSMAWGHAPDDARNFILNGNNEANEYGYKTSQCNSIYYNPSIIYRLPKKADGSDYAAPTFTAAWYNGYNTGAGTVNLATSFKAYDPTTSFTNFDDTLQAAYYYRYTGAQTIPDFSNTTNTWYKECNSAVGSSPGNAVFTKVTLTSASAEAQNFANWYSYYRTRMLMMKSGAGRAFNTIGSTYRVGFTTINYTGTDTTNAEFLNISDFDATQKASWYTKIYAITPGSGTPLRTALAKVGRIYAGKIGTDPVQYSCQQNFTILTTDGFWNDTTNPKRMDGSTDIGNQDSTLPRPQYEGGTAYTNTLADVAAYYYVNDLRPGAVGSAACTTGVSGADVCLDNVPVSGLDNAPHQHMTTFTLGLGVNGTLRYADDYLTGGSADYNAIVAGSKNWPKPVADTLTAIDDLWHAAVNGSGQYFSARNPDLLVTGLRTALAGVSAREAAGAAAATSNLEPIAGDNFAFIANYRTVKWDGDVQARLIDLTTGALSATSTWSAQGQLDLKVSATGDTRRIFTLAAAGTGTRDFLPGNFSATEKTNWFTPSNAPALSQSSGWTPAEALLGTADNLINYLRGQTGYDMRSANTVRLFREREHVLGDVINGKPVYAKKPPFKYTENAYQTFVGNNVSRQGVVYAASNDGMLHALNADTGVEMWAYIPSFVLPKMKQLADANYGTNHTYLTDGSPTVSDIWTGSAWKTILVAGLNAGGRGYYALDITTPAAPTVLWEFSDNNMGLTFGNPLIGKLVNGTWIVAFTSGYNNAPPTAPSGDGVGRLFVVNAATGALIYTIPTTGVGNSATPNNLGKINGWVDDGTNDNTIQRIYGGDHLGNVWRFDINDVLPGTASGRDAFKLATLMSGANPQPITTRPELGLVGTKVMVYIGTGRYVGIADVSDTSQQTLYAIKDRLDATELGNPRTNASCAFVKQDLGALDANTRVITSNRPVNLNIDTGSGATCGWYVDFNPSNQSPGERINIDLELQLGVLSIITNVPENSVCTVGGSSYIYFFDYAKGTNVGDFVEITDVNGVPSVHASNKVGEKIGNELTVGKKTIRLDDGRTVTEVTTAGDKHLTFGNPVATGVSAATRRVLWRELLN
jgi:type IV pilus assembly protein PilY1